MATQGFIHFGPYRVHPTQGLFRGELEVPVTPKALAVLLALARRPREVVTRTELFDTVWAGRVVSDAALSSCIRDLREALGDCARAPRFLETVHGRGFRLCAAAQRDDELGEQDVRNAQPTLLVLPFDNVSGSPHAGILATGLTHDVITHIARSRLTLVIARGTAFHFAGRDRDVGEIGKKLGVRYVVQGAVQVENRRLVLTVELSEAPARRIIWAERFSRSIDDWMVLQQELSELIVASIEHQVQAEEIRRSQLLPSEDLDAWSAYHRGLSHMYRFRERDCQRAEHWFRRSIELEPGISRPWAGLSFVNFERAFLNREPNREQQIEQALDLAQRGVAIDSYDPMAHWALSRAHLLRGELDESKDAVETAIRLNPSYAIAQYSRGWVGLQRGENQVCDDRIGFARRLSPYDPLKYAMLGVSGLNLAMIGRHEEALDLARQSLQHRNAHYLVKGFAAVTCAVSGHFEQASDYLKQIRAVSPGYDVDDFLMVFRFQREQDLSQVNRAFTEMRRLAG